MFFGFKLPEEKYKSNRSDYLTTFPLLRSNEKANEMNRNSETPKLSLMPEKFNP